MKLFDDLFHDALNEPLQFHRSKTDALQQQPALIYFLFMVLFLHATHWDVVALRRRARRSITDLFCTVIQLDLVGNSVVFIIAHGFLLSSVAQPAGRDHA